MVMYRDFATRKARGLGLVGEVINLPDGTVRVIAEGTEEKLHDYIPLLRQGSILAHVVHVEVSWRDAASTYKKFIITY
jgi:acylphosphatase